MTRAALQTGLRRVSELRAEPVRWLWSGRLALGKLAMLEGDPGLGKSLVSLDLCARLSRGRAFPDGFATLGPSSSLVLNAEDGQADTVRTRLAGLDADLDRVFVLGRSGDGEDLLRLPSQLRQLDDALVRTKARLVVLDPLIAFLDGGVSSGNEECVRRVLAPLAALAARHECAVLLVRHLNKQGGRRAIYQGGGAIGLVGACRSAWLVGRDPAVPGQCVLAQVKNNLAATQPSLAYRVVATGDGHVRLTWQGVSAWSADQLQSGRSRASAKLRARAYLLAALEGGPRLVRELWDEGQKQGLSARTLRRAMQDLSIHSQRVARDGRRESYWLLPGQVLPGQSWLPGDDLGLEPWLEPLREMYPPATPLDEE
jgi:hypothetical protein